MKRFHWWVSLNLVVLASIIVISYAGTQPQSIRVTILYGLSGIQLLLALPTYFLLSRVFADDGFETVTRDPLGRCVAIVSGAIVLVLALTVTAYLTQRGIMVLPGLPQIAWLVLYHFVLIAMTEEIIFRGLPFALLPARSWIAVLVSSLLFALYHWNNGLFTLPYYFAMGLTFGVLRHFGFSLLTLTIGHGLFNLTFSLIWPIDGFKFGIGAFYMVMPMAYLCLAALSGWMLSSIDNHQERKLEVC